MCWLKMEDLMDELKMKIFLYCTGSLKDLCNVNKHFANLISESPELMVKMPLVLESKRKEEKYKTILRSQRKFQKIIVRYDYNFGESGMKIIKKFSGSLKHLKFVRCIFGAQQFVSSLLYLIIQHSINLNTFLAWDPGILSSLGVPWNPHVLHQAATRLFWGSWRYYWDNPASLQPIIRFEAAHDQEEWWQVPEIPVQL